MAKHVQETEFEYDWVIKKREKDELAKLKLNPSLTTAQINANQKSLRQQQTNNTSRMHSADSRGQPLSPFELEKKQNEIDLIKEQAKKRRQEKLKVILMQVDSSKPPKTQEELNQEKEEKRVEEEKKKEEQEKELRMKQKEEEDFLHKQKIQEKQLTGSTVIKQLNTLFGAKKPSVEHEPINPEPAASKTNDTTKTSTTPVAEEKGGLKSLMSSGIMNTKIDPKGNGLGLASLLKKAAAS